MFEGTNARTFEAGPGVGLAGAEPALCARNIYFGHSTGKMRLSEQRSPDLHREGRLAWTAVTQEQCSVSMRKKKTAKDW